MMFTTDLALKVDPVYREITSRWRSICSAMSLRIQMPVRACAQRLQFWTCQASRSSRTGS